MQDEPRVEATPPEIAQTVLGRGVLCYLAVDTRRGPHLTPMVYATHRGRLWVTTTRRSVKAVGWRRDPRVAGLVTDGDLTVSVRGDVTTYDAFDPLSWPRVMASGPRLAEAATKFSLRNARFFAGYAVDARRVPLAWTPPGRLFAAVRPAAGWVLGGDRLESWGRWARGARFAGRFETGRRARGLDLKVPDEVRTSIGRAGSGALALRGSMGLVVLPVAWRRIGREGSYEATLPREVLELSAAGPDAPAALTVDHASTWRAAAMRGMLLQGTARLFAPEARVSGRDELLERLGGDEDLALVRLRPNRIVWWRGWQSGSVTAR